MRFAPILLALAAICPAVAQEGGAPDQKAQLKELEGKMKAIRETTIKGDEELAKLKSAADEAKKAYEGAVEQKLAGNEEYSALKAQVAEMKGKKDEKKKEEKKEEAPKPEAPKSE
jgi:hypothetical protein